MKLVFRKKKLFFCLVLSCMTLLALTFSITRVMAANLMGNPGFETGSLAPWTQYGGATVSNTNQRSGVYCISLPSTSSGGAAEQVITGLTPNTAYTLTGYVKSGAGNTVWLGVKEYGGVDTAQTTTAKVYTVLTVDFKTGAANTSAKIYIYTNAAGGFNGDDLSIQGPGTVTPSPTPVPSVSKNLLSNPGFETSNLTPWTQYGGATVINTNQRSGAYCISLPNVTSGGAAEQVITGLTPNTAYTLIGYVKSGAGNTVWLGVKEYGGVDTAQTTTAKSYTLLTINFKTGAANTSARVYIYTNAAGAAYGDDLDLNVANIAPPTVTPTSTPTPRPTATSTPTSTPTPRPTATSTPTSTPTPRPTPTPTPTPVSGSAQLPNPPAPYVLPANPVVVNSTSAFISAFTSTTAKDIVLANGTYTNSSYIVAGAPHRIWAQTLGGVTLKFGLSLRGSGSELHGIKFDINTFNYAYNGAAIFIEDKNPNSKIYDSWINGNMILNAGIMSRSTSGLVVKRSIINGFKQYGLFWETYGPASNYLNDTPAVPPVIEDVDISAIYDSPRGVGNGRWEAGLWASTICNVNRIKITDTGWMGVWTGGNCNDAVFSNISIDNVYNSSGYGTGIYVEHYTRRTVFKNLQIGPISGSPTANGHLLITGINSEWADPAVDANPDGGGRGAGHNNTIQNGTINSSREGISLEDAENTLVQGMTFKNQSRIALKDFITPGTGARYTTTWQNQGNNFSGILPGCASYSNAH